MPHDVQGLINLVGGREAFVEKLDTFFGRNLYNHGNEVDLHVPYLYNYAGVPWKTQEIVRKITAEKITSNYGTHVKWPEPIHDRIYKNTPDGFLYEMDDDCGTMSSWFIFSAIGIYPACPGDTTYEIGSPLFDKVTIHLDEKYYRGRNFTVVAKNVSVENKYIQSGTLNGAPLDKPWIEHSSIVNGGILIFEMGPEPNKEGGSMLRFAPQYLS